MILACWEFVIFLESVSGSEWENLGREEVVEEVDFSEDLSRVVFPWAGARIGHSPSSAGFQLFLAGYLLAVACLHIKAHGYTDLAGSQNNLYLTTLKQEALCSENEIYPDGDGHLQAKSQLCDACKCRIYKPQAECCRIHCALVRWG